MNVRSQFALGEKVDVIGAAGDVICTGRVVAVGGDGYCVQHDAVVVPAHHHQLRRAAAKLPELAAVGAAPKFRVKSSP
jgi:hypothetical protein